MVYTHTSVKILIYENMLILLMDPYAPKPGLPNYVYTNAFNLGYSNQDMKFIVKFHALTHWWVSGGKT